MRLLIVLFFSFLVLNSGEITLNWIKEKPKGTAKDFFIWRFLTQPDTNATSALDAISMVSNLNPSLRTSYKKFGDADKVFNDIKNKTQKKEEPKTILSIVAPNNIIKTDFPEVKFDANLTQRKASPIQISKKITQNPANIIAYSTEIEKRHLHAEMLQANFGDISSTQHFYLFLSAINLEKNEIAKEHLKMSIQKAKMVLELDRALFWDFLVFGNQKSLERLAQSYDINFYSVQAREKLGKGFDDIVYDIETDGNETVGIDLKDPFLCVSCISKMHKSDTEEFEKYQQIFSSSKNSKPQLSSLLTALSGYKANFFLTPYEDILGNIANDEKALIYALGRQESRFLPNVVSRSFAVGSMQIMPFVAEDIAKKLNEPYEIDKLFEPAHNIKYAIKVINLIKKDFTHPLFVAYSYNGGAGALKKILKRGYFKLDKFEPFMSMELYPRPETRDYGKQVLANYYIYKNYLNNEKIKFEDLLQNLASGQL